MSRRNKTIVAVGLIVLMATVIIATLCIDDWSGITGWAFGTMLWSEIAFFGGLMFVEWIAEKSEQIITRSTLYTLLSLYAFINIFISILYISAFKEATTSFVIIQVILFAVTAITILVSLTVSRSVYLSNAKTMGAANNAEALIERLNKLALSPACEKYAPAIEKLSNDLRFTDISESVPEYAEISDTISSIELASIDESENASEAVSKAFIRLNSLIAKRSLSVGATKKGKI